MTNIRAYSQIPDDDHMYVCGDFNQDEEEKKDVDVIADEEMAIGKYRSSEEEILVAANIL